MVFLGFPKRTGEEDQQRAGLEAFCPRAHRRQPRRLLLGQGPDAGVEHTLGDGVCTLHIKADALRSSSAAGKSLVNCSWGLGRKVSKPPQELLLRRTVASAPFLTGTVMEKEILRASLPCSPPQEFKLLIKGSFLIFT